jgi:hypothetical protein
MKAKIERVNMIHIKDNFFKNPDAVRSFALKQKFYNPLTGPHLDSNFPGKRSDFLNRISNDIFMELTQGIYKLFDLPSDTFSFTMSSFQICTEEDGESWVHRDSVIWEPTNVGVVYLTPDPPENSGTLLYEVPENYSDDEPRSNFDFVIKKRLDNKYNRLVMYDPYELHKSDTYFGSDLHNGRLFIAFFMRIDTEAPIIIKADTGENTDEHK